jgi:hypothetical protein
MGGISYKVWLRDLCAGLSWLLPKHLGASIWNKGVVESVHIVGNFYYFTLDV